jgi:hypothetical protein
MRLLARASLLVSFLVASAGAAGLAACFGDDSFGNTDAGDGGGHGDASDVMVADMSSEPTPCTPYVSDAGLTTPTTTYSMDVATIFQHSCALGEGACHGDPNEKTQGRPYLGLPDGGGNAAQVLMGIVGVKSTEDPSMNVVTAGDPSKSFLMHNMDNDQNCFAADCANNGTPYTNCGGLMPSLNPLLDQPTRDTVRRWIAQGAKNN